MLAGSRTKVAQGGDGDLPCGTMSSRISTNFCPICSLSQNIVPTPREKPSASRSRCSQSTIPTSSFSTPTAIWRSVPTAKATRLSRARISTCSSSFPTRSAAASPAFLLSIKVFAVEPFCAETGSPVSTRFLSQPPFELSLCAENAAAGGGDDLRHGVWSESKLMAIPQTDSQGTGGTSARNLHWTSRFFGENRRTRKIKGAKIAPLLKRRSLTSEVLPAHRYSAGPRQV